MSENADQRPPAEPLCPACGYSLVGLSSRGCPECGALIAAPASRMPTPRSMWVAVIALGVGAVAAWLGAVLMPASGTPAGADLAGLRLSAFASAVLATPLVLATLAATVHGRGWLWTIAMIASAPGAFVLFLVASPTAVTAGLFAFGLLDEPVAHRHWVVVVPVWCAGWAIVLSVQLFKHHAALAHTRGATVPAANRE